MVILVLGLAASVGGALVLEQLGETREQQRFEAEVDQATAAIDARLATYVAVLQAGAGLFAASDQVTLREFEAFASRVQLTQRYPGIQGIGYAARTKAAEGDAFPIVYLEPQDARNSAALGFDMYASPARRAAMAQARDTGLPTASGRVELVQEINEDKQAGFLVYEPVYAEGEVPPTVEQRRDRLQGFVYAPFRAGDLLHAVFASSGAAPYRYAVYSGPRARENLLFASGPAEEADLAGMSAIRRLPVAGRSWTIVYWAGPDFPLSGARQMAWIFFFGGLVATLLVATATWRQGKARVAAEREVVARKAIEARQTLLLDELNHRVKNTLATVQSIAAQSLRQGDVDSVRRNFEDRLIALSHAHNLLTRDGWRGAALQELAETELRPYAGSTGRKIQLSGPEVWLSPNTAVALGMALHELTTNAVKYGALSVEAGRVLIAWEVEGREGGSERVRLVWREAGGPPVATPSRRGFGSRLIVGGLAHQLGGKVDLDFQAEGVVCTIVFDKPSHLSGEMLKVGAAA